MNDLNKTLIILSPGFPENEADSTCVTPQQVFVRNLKRSFPLLNIVVLAFEYPFFPAEYEWNGLTVISFGGRNRGKFYRLRNWARVSSTLTRLNKKHQIIGLLSFWMGDCAFIANRFAKRYKLKHLCWILGQDAKPGNKYFKMIKPQDESLIALSDFITREFHKNYDVKPANVIPVGIDPGLFYIENTKKDIDILGAGSLIALKQFTVLVNMVKDLREKFPAIKAVICGAGPERRKLDKLIKEHHLENNIELTGVLSHAQVLALMQRTKIFVHPSAYEGFGVVCLEALYAGAHVVSFVQPMNENIRKWHYAQGEDDMLNIINGLLKETKPDNCKVDPYLVADSCKAMMRLFDYNELAVIN